MKKIVIFLLIAGLALLFTPYARAGWILYDNFESGDIDPDKWDSYECSATISIQDGKAKFDHKMGCAHVPSFLSFKKKPENIIGIRATATVESCAGDVRGLIGAFIGKLGDDYIADQLCVQAGQENIWGNLMRLEGGINFLHELFFGNFHYPIDILGNPFTITIIYLKKYATYEVDGLGKITFKLPESLAPTDDHLKFIGTRSENGDGPCVVYFDDVYILRCPFVNYSR